MMIVVIGGSGLIGANLVNRLRKQGHDVVAASPKTGVNTITLPTFYRGVRDGSRQGA